MHVMSSFQNVLTNLGFQNVRANILYKNEYLFGETDPQLLTDQKHYIPDHMIKFLLFLFCFFWQGPGRWGHKTTDPESLRF